MYLSPTHVTPDDHHDLANNPWLESRNDRRGASDKSTTNLSANIQQISRGGLSHTRSHTTAGHPLRAPSPPATAELYPASGHASSLDLHETCPSLRRVINASWSSSNGDSRTNGGHTCEHNGLEARRETDAEVIVHQVYCNFLGRCGTLTPIVDPSYRLTPWRCPQIQYLACRSSEREQALGK